MPIQTSWRSVSPDLWKPPPPQPRKALPGLEQDLALTRIDSAWLSSARNRIVDAFNAGTSPSGERGYFDEAALRAVGDQFLTPVSRGGLAAARVFREWLRDRPGLRADASEQAFAQRVQQASTAQLDPHPDLWPTSRQSSPIIRDHAYEARVAQDVAARAQRDLQAALAQARHERVIDPRAAQMLVEGARGRPTWQVEDLARNLRAGLDPTQAQTRTDRVVAEASRMRQDHLAQPMIQWLNSPRPAALKGSAAPDTMTEQLFFERARAASAGS